MKKETYTLLEDYMNTCMNDAAHDRDHVYRVLYNALRIARTEKGVDHDVLLAACLLHDIARAEQFADPKKCHARMGAQKAMAFLRENGFDEGFSVHVGDCIRTHRFRSDDPPASIEAKILFDADKLDVSGAMGMARSLFYCGHVGRVLYTLKPDGSVSDGRGDTEPSLFQEYCFKLEKLYDRFYTAEGARLARQRQQAAARIYNDLVDEACTPYIEGKPLLAGLLQ